jgi:membrane associated rhomboid family serine protease
MFPKQFYFSVHEHQRLKNLSNVYLPSPAMGNLNISILFQLVMIGFCSVTACRPFLGLIFGEISFWKN